MLSFCTQCVSFVNFLLYIMWSYACTMRCVYTLSGPFGHCTVVYTLVTGPYCYPRCCLIVYTIQRFIQYNSLYDTTRFYNENDQTQYFYLNRFCFSKLVSSSWQPTCVTSSVQWIVLDARTTCPGQLRTHCLRCVCVYILTACAVTACRLSFIISSTCNGQTQLYIGVSMNSMEWNEWNIVEWVSSKHNCFAILCFSCHNYCGCNSYSMI